MRHFRPLALRAALAAAATLAVVAAPTGKASEADAVASLLAQLPSDGRSCAAEPLDLMWARLPASLRDVPLEAMIGQLLIVSYSGTSPESAGVRATVDLLAASKVGGVLTFRHNVGTAAELAAVNQAFATAHQHLPAIVAVDQEGGAVARLKPTEGVPATPAAEAIAKTTVAEATEAYRDMADAMAKLGFTANFGPVVDLNVEPSNPVIARFGRSYGPQSDTVVAYAGAFIEAHEVAGVATALKHFPGHGSSKSDSHDGAIDLTPTWTEAELQPFGALIEQTSVDMVMIGHLMLEGMTGDEGVPASLSRRAITDVLRGQLCFEGLVVTDDLAMQAIAAHFPATEAAKRLIAAGGDLILISLSPETGYAAIDDITAALKAQAEADPAFANKVRTAYARIVHHKLDRRAADPAQD